MSSSFVSVHKAKNRYFWVAWTHQTDQQPDFTGYANSEAAALGCACAALGQRLTEINRLKAEAAKRWRGIISCKHCESRNLEVLPGKAHLLAKLQCRDCGGFNKWLSESQLGLFQTLQPPT